jgi:SAM-dependent methyltransferase
MARLTPWLRSSQEEYFSRLEALVKPGMRILDIGCGREFLLSWLEPERSRRWAATLDTATVFGVDPHLPSLKGNRSRLVACAIADALPLGNSRFDLVTANMVVEHLGAPDLVLQELHRVLTPDGAFLFHTPNLRAPLVALSHVTPHAVKRAIVPVIEGGRGAEDVFPTHYRLNTPSAIESAATRAGFRVAWIHYVFSAPLTQMLGPLVAIELLLVRLLKADRFARLRPDLICLLTKRA